MPVSSKADHKSDTGAMFRRLLKNVAYREGVIAQMFYVAAQIMCWTFIIQYAENLGIPKAEAQRYNIIAMGMFLSSRFISTFLMKYVNSRKLLTIFAIGGMITTLGTIFIVGMGGLYCLIATSAFMSLMFPTIYGIALEGIGEDATLGAAGLVMAIVGGGTHASFTGSNHRFGNRCVAAGCKLLVCASAYQLYCYCFLRVPCPEASPPGFYDQVKI